MASRGGSLFCSWTCPEQGSHTVVLDGSLFEKEQGGHTFALNRMERRRHVAPFLGSHAANHASTTADIDRGRAPGLSFPRCRRRGRPGKSATTAGSLQRSGVPSLPSCPWSCPVLVSVLVRPWKPHASACSPSRCYFGRKTDCACQDVSAAAEKRACLESAFMAASTESLSPSRPAWRAPIGCAALQIQNSELEVRLSCLPYVELCF